MMMQDQTAQVLDRMEAWAVHAEAIVREAAPEVWGISMERAYASAITDVVSRVAVLVAVVCLALYIVPKVVREWRKPLSDQDDTIGVGGAMASFVLVGIIFTLWFMALAAMRDLLSIRYEALRLLAELVR